MCQESRESCEGESISLAGESARTMTLVRKIEVEHELSMESCDRTNTEYYTFPYSTKMWGVS